MKTEAYKLSSVTRFVHGTYMIDAMTRPDKPVVGVLSTSAWSTVGIQILMP